MWTSERSVRVCVHPPTRTHMSHTHKHTWTHRIDSRQLLTHVHGDDGDELPAQRTERQKVEDGQTAFGFLRAVLHVHLLQLRFHLFIASHPLQRLRQSQGRWKLFLDSAKKRINTVKSITLALYSFQLHHVTGHYEGYHQPLFVQGKFKLYYRYYNEITRKY